VLRPKTACRVCARRRRRWKSNIARPRLWSLVNISFPFVCFCLYCFCFLGLKSKLGQAEQRADEAEQKRKDLQKKVDELSIQCEDLTRKLRAEVGAFFLFFFFFFLSVG
jgi:hypothetical protein